MDVAMQPEFVPAGNDLLRHFGIPGRNLAHQIQAGLRAAQLLKDWVNGKPGETGIQFATLV